jgi:hypothetical protein
MYIIIIVVIVRLYIMKIIFPLQYFQYSTSHMYVFLSLSPELSLSIPTFWNKHPGFSNKCPFYRLSNPSVFFFWLEHPVYRLLLSKVLLFWLFPKLVLKYIVPISQNNFYIKYYDLIFFSIHSKIMELKYRFYSDFIIEYSLMIR